jgi:formate/nitrite transporter FocA (FNT family)
LFHSPLHLKSIGGFPSSLTTHSTLSYIALMTQINLLGTFFLAIAFHISTLGTVSKATLKSKKAKFTSFPLSINLSHIVRIK